MRVRSLASLSGLRILSGIAVSGYSSNSTPSLGTSICCDYGPKTNKQTNQAIFHYQNQEVCDQTLKRHMQVPEECSSEHLP